ncbi:MAG TPA: glycoside hydrolase family 3 C-terminal domain-containing protein [Polyangiaceae bacterium]
MRTTNNKQKKYLPAVAGGALVLAIGATLPLACSLTPTNPVAAAGDSSTGNSTSSGADTSTGGSGTTTGGSGTTTGGSGTTTGGMMMVAQDDPSCQKDPFTRANMLDPIDPTVTTTITNLSQSDKLNILNGGQVCPNYDCDFNATGIPSQGYQDMPMRDGPRGVHQLTGAQSTTWAVAEARAATWDTALELRVGTAQGEEMRAYKYDTSLSPTINVLRHPGWARAQETYGEDPVLVGEMGAQFTAGMQKNVMACPKHFAANDTDNNRHTAYAQMDEQTLRENYTRAFGIIVQKADPACIMAAYNGITITDSATDKTGHWCTESHHLLTDILRTEWNWKGYVVSDWWATKANGAASINAGLDLEMPDMSAFQQLPTDLTNNTVTTATVVQADTRLLNARQHFKNNTTAYQNSPMNAAIVQNTDHIAIAKQTSLEGAVLLKNSSILPIPAGKSIILLGPDNNLPDASKVGTEGAASGLGDRGSSNTTPPYAVSYAAGLKTLGYTVTQSANSADANKADIAIVIVSMAHEDEGEAFDNGADRQNLNLAGPHPLHWSGTKPSAFINAAAQANPNLIVLLNVGSAIVMEDWMNSAKGIVQTFYPGQEGGNAVAELLTGKANFSGKLPFTVAEKETDYPSFQNNNANAMTFDYLHGYRKFEAQGLTPRFWFGYGLSYTTFKYSNLKILCSNAISRTGRLNVQVTVQNTGMMDGDEIVELYVGDPTAAPGVRRPKKELKAFTRVHIPAGMSQDVQLSVPASYIAYYDGTKNINGWSFEPTGYMYDLIVAGSSDPMDANLQKASFSIAAN